MLDTGVLCLILYELWNRVLYLTQLEHN